MLKFQHDLEALDPRGRTPLMLSVVLGHLESARLLLKYGADATFQDKKYWSGTNLFAISLMSIFPLLLSNQLKISILLYCSRSRSYKHR